MDGLAVQTGAHAQRAVEQHVELPITRRGTMIGCRT
jgi:hypothetical protein